MGVAMDLAQRQALKAYAKQDYEKQVVANAGAAQGDYSSAGPPFWDRGAWDAFRAQYGFYPYSATELPTSFEGAPDWVYELMNLRRPHMMR